jgi:hypothetical protein
MEELAGMQAQLAWQHLEELYRSGMDKGKELKRSFFQQLRGNEPFRRTARMKDELMAHIRWSSRIIQARATKHACTMHPKPFAEECSSISSEHGDMDTVYLP